MRQTKKDLEMQVEDLQSKVETLEKQLANQERSREYYVQRADKFSDTISDIEGFLALQNVPSHVKENGYDKYLGLFARLMYFLSEKKLANSNVVMEEEQCQDQSL